MVQKATEFKKVQRTLNISRFGRSTLAAGRLYVMNRGYAKYDLLQTILNAGSGFIVRLRDNAVFEVEEELLLSDNALRANVVRDAIVRLGCKSNRSKLQQAIPCANLILSSFKYS